MIRYYDMPVPRPEAYMDNICPARGKYYYCQRYYWAGPVRALGPNCTGFKPIGTGPSRPWTNRSKPSIRYKGPYGPLQLHKNPNGPSGHQVLGTYAQGPNAMAKGHCFGPVVPKAKGLGAPGNGFAFANPSTMALAIAKGQGAVGPIGPIIYPEQRPQVADMDHSVRPHFTLIKSNLK